MLVPQSRNPPLFHRLLYRTLGLITVRTVCKFTVFTQDKKFTEIMCHVLSRKVIKGKVFDPRTIDDRPGISPGEHFGVCGRMQSFARPLGNICSSQTQAWFQSIQQSGFAYPGLPSEERNFSIQIRLELRYSDVRFC